MFLEGRLTIVCRHSGWLESNQPPLVPETSVSPRDYTPLQSSSRESNPSITLTMRPLYHWATRAKSIFEKSRFELELLVHEIPYRIEDSNLTCQGRHLELYPVKLYIKDTQYSRGDSNPLTSASAELRSSHWATGTVRMTRFELATPCSASRYSTNWVTFA